MMFTILTLMQITNKPRNKNLPEKDSDTVEQYSIGIKYKAAIFNHQLILTNHASSG